MSALDDVDIVCWVADMTELAARVERQLPIITPEEEQVAKAVAGCGKPVVFVANKIDVIPYPLLLPVFGAMNNRMPLAASIPVSALTGDGVPLLLAEIRTMLPEGPKLYPEDEWTQVTERFLVAEIVREKLFHLMAQEIPYATFVEVMQFDESKRAEGRVRILCDITVERGSQKGIVIGKGGEMLKRVGTMARKEIMAVLDCRVHLELFVKVEKDWTKSKRGLRKVGFDTPT
jgi:GTP-binding protein Era